jgi:nucleoid-associated protein YgaU
MKNLLIILVIASAMFSQNSYDYENMTKEQYTAELLKWQNKRKSSEARLAELEKEMAALQADEQKVIADTDQARTDLAVKAGLADQAGLDAYLADLSSLRSEVETFMSQSPEEAYKNRAELAKLRARLEAHKTSNGSHVAEALDMIASIDSLLVQAAEKATLPNTVYEVQKGDYLWKIAKKDDVYGDAYGWTRIYNANKNLINDPNLIFASQVFSVPRSVEANQYLIKRGDNLFNIAKEFGSVFSWTKLHEANSTLIEDANVIFPHQVLTVPSN